MKPSRNRAFSLIELMVVVATIGILALLGVPGITKAAQRTEAVATGNDLRVFSEAIEFYATTSGGYPENMDYTNMPSEVSAYLPSLWRDGSYSWFYVHDERFTYLFMANLGLSTEQAVTLDATIDDGNIATGNVRIAFNGNGLVYLFRWNQSA